MFFGCFIALLWILAYRWQGAADALPCTSWPPMPPARCVNRWHHRGGVYLGLAAEKWLSRFSWVALVLAIIIGTAMTLLL